MTTELTEALRMHREGRYADAARRYHAVLTREPDQVEALHFFGVMHHECGHSARAIELIARAAALRPGEALFYSNMAEIHRSLGQLDDAIRCGRAALRLRPDYPEAANNLGLAHQAAGHHDEAIAAFLDALKRKPDFGLARNNLGILYRELERPVEAREAFFEAVRVEPTLAVARSNLGQSLIDLGELEEGLAHCREAVRLDPSLAAAHNNLGNALRLLRRWEEAHSAYDVAARLDPDEPKVHVNRALTFIAEARPLAAASSLRRAVELAPDDPDLWHPLAEAHLADEDHAAAIPWLRRLADHRPDRPTVHTDLGWALQNDGRYDEAAACHRKALELRPDFLEALLNQGNLHEELGDLDQAEAYYRRAIQAHPTAPGPLARLAILLRGRLPMEDRQSLRERLDDPGLDDSPRSNLLFALAHVLDALGEPLEAASCLEKANALAIRLRDRSGQAYDPIEHRRFVDRLIRSFTPELFARLAGSGDPTRQPVFVFGMPRSGTTLVEQILASHSRVHGAGELRLAARTFEAIPEVVGRDHGLPEALDHLDANGLKWLADRYLAGVRELLDREPSRALPDRVVDKMPDNYLYVGMLSILFPRATFIHVLRDPRDVALSCWMTNFRSIRWANDVDHLAGRFEEHRRVTDHWRSVAPVKIHEVVYERLVDDFEPEATRLIEACGLDWEPGCRRFHEINRPVRTASVTQVRQPLYRKALGRWRAYEAPLAELFGRLPGGEP